MRRAWKNWISCNGGKKKLTLLLCAAALLTVGIGATFSYLVKETPTLVNRFLNGIIPAGDVVIQKSVSHPFGDSYTVPEALAFTFEVNLGQHYAGETVNTSQGRKTADENGVITVTVAPGGRTSLYDIDDGTAVTVTETNIGKGFTPDAASQEVMVEKYKDHILTFTNTYAPEKADTSALTLSGVSSLADRAWQEGDSFTFELSVYQDGEWISLGTRTVTYELVEVADPTSPTGTVFVEKPDYNKFDFTEILQSLAFDKTGTYSFRVSEAGGNVENIICNPADCKFEVLVGDADMDGSLEIQSVTTPSANVTVDNTAVTAYFVNIYAPGSTTATVEIQKALEDTSGQNKTPAGFFFELYDEENNLIALSEATIATGETAIWLNYGLADAGKTYTYILKEVNGGQTMNAVTYDSKEYKLRVSVVDNLDGTVSAYVYDWQQPSTIPEGATNTYQASFTNKYEPEEVTVDLGGTKTLSGRVLKDLEFTFLLYQTDSSFTLAEGTQPLDSKKNVSGSFVFDALTFDKVGTYYYLVVEDASAALGGITYDKTSYLVTIVVADANGVLIAAVTVTDGYGEEKTIAFANSYAAKPVFLPLGGEVMLEGGNRDHFRFSFKLHVADESFTPSAAVLQTAANGENGKFFFKDLGFVKAGTYYYVVVEDDFPVIDGLSYDDTVYQIKVVVTDPGDGQLVISEHTITADGETVTDITFGNTFVKPTEPEETTTPSEPEGTTTPSEPEGTTTPSEPEGTTTPSEPEGTTTPSEPEGTTTPSEPEETTTPSEPEGTTTPSEPEETTTPNEPEETTTPSEPKETTAPTEPEGTTTPTEPGQTTPPTEPGDEDSPPDTRDYGTPVIWFALMVMSLTEIALLSELRRRSTRR